MGKFFKSLAFKISFPLIVMGILLTCITYYVMTHSPNDDEGKLYRLVWLVIGNSCLTIISVWVLVRIFISKRLNHIKDFVKSKLSSGSIDIVEVGGRDEIYNLTCIFNQIIESNDQHHFILREKEQELEEKNKFISLGLESSQIGLWDWNLQQNTIWYSPYAKAMLGYKDDELENSLDTLEKIMSPEDYPEASRVMKECIRTGNDYEKLSKFYHKDGSEKYIICRAKFVFHDGNPVRIIGSHTDVTETKTAEAKEL